MPTVYAARQPDAAPPAKRLLAIYDAGNRLTRFGLYWLGRDAGGPCLLCDDLRDGDELEISPEDGPRLRLRVAAGPTLRGRDGLAVPLHQVLGRPARRAAPLTE